MTRRRALQSVLTVAMLAFIANPVSGTWYFITNPSNCSGNWDLGWGDLDGCEVWYGGQLRGEAFEFEGDCRAGLWCDGGSYFTDCVAATSWNDDDPVCYVQAQTAICKSDYGIYFVHCP